MSELTKYWNDFCVATNRIRELPEIRTNNIVGEMAEAVLTSHLGLTISPPNLKGVDAVCPDGKKHQIKSRWLRNNEKKASLNWLGEFQYDYLTVIIFGYTGSIDLAMTIPVNTAKEKAFFNGRSNTNLSIIVGRHSLGWDGVEELIIDINDLPKIEPAPHDHLLEF